MKKFNKISVVVLAIALTLGLAGMIRAATTIDLGTVDDFAVLSGSTLTNTGPSVINGDLGLHPGTSVTGFPPGTVNGEQHVTDATALQAQNDLTTAYNNAAGQTPVTAVSTELGGTTKTAGIYNSASGTFGITGTLILDAQGDPDAVFIFKTASTLITANASKIILINGAQACHVFWQVGSSATLGANSTFRGNILALTSVTLTTGATVEGRVLARNGAVTLDTNTITMAICAASPTPATLHVIKQVVNDDDGTAVPSDFTMHVKNSGVDVSGSPTAGTGIPGISYSLYAGTYVVSENTYPSYVQSFSGDCDSNGSVTLSAGDDKTCTIINNDVAAIPETPAILHVIKEIVNDDGGTATVSLFNLHVKNSGVDVSGSPAVGTATPGTSYSLVAGTYLVSEDSYPSYVQSFSGDCDSNGSVTLAAGDDKTCTITNNDVAAIPETPATLHVVKQVVNDNGGTATVSLFNLHVKLSGVDVAGSPTAGTVTPGTSYSLVAGTYVVSEDSYPSYAQSFSGDCDSNGSVTLAADEDKTCTITNNDIATPVVVPPTTPNTGVTLKKSILVAAGIFTVLLLFYVIRKKADRVANR